MIDEDKEIVRVYTLVVDGLKKRMEEYELKMNKFIYAIDRLADLEERFHRTPNTKQKLIKKISEEFGWDEWKVGNSALTIKQMEQICERLKV